MFSFLFHRFQFQDTGPLVDGELELIQPDHCWVEDVMAACHHPLTVQDAPAEARLTREQLEQFLKAAPLGREPASISRNRAPTYHFWLLLHHNAANPSMPPPVRIAGAVGLRIGSTPSLKLYYGHIGYHVYPPARGNHYAERACRLLYPLARRHGLKTLWITCNPDNAASRRTCERLNARLVEVVEVPYDDPLHARGEFEKCRYRLDI